MINQDKPTQGTPETYLNIGSGFNLIIGGVYKLIVGAENLLTGMTNTTKVSIGETWGHIATTWATETDTWLGISQMIDNTSKPVTSISNVIMSATQPLWNYRTFPWELSEPWQHNP